MKDHHFMQVGTPHVHAALWCKSCGTVQTRNDDGKKVWYIPGVGKKPNSQECVTRTIIEDLQAEIEVLKETINCYFGKYELAVTVMQRALSECANMARYQHLDKATIQEVGERIVKRAQEAIQTVLEVTQ